MQADPGFRIDWEDGQRRERETGNEEQKHFRRLRETPWKHGVRGNRDFARGLTLDFPVKPPRIVLLQRSHLSLSLFLSLSSTFHSPPTLSLTLRSPRAMWHQSKFRSVSLSFFPSPPPLLYLSHSLHFVMLCLCTPWLLHCLISSLCNVKWHYSFAKVRRAAKCRCWVTVNNRDITLLA